MAHVNGDTATTSPVADDDSTISVAHQSAVKRKRDDSLSDHIKTSDPSRTPTQQIQNDILEVLERHDVEPSFLNHVFKREPSQKKAKLSEPPDASATIAAKLKATSYSSLQDIKADANTVAQELVSTIRGRVKEKDGGRPSLDDLKQIRRVQMIESLVKDIVDKEEQHVAVNSTKGSTLKREDSAKPNGVLRKDNTPQKPSAVLTLFGAAPTPKQLFSSMQKPQSSLSGPMIKSELPVEEMSLPNGITATRVLPLPTVEAKGPTFEDVFAPPYSLPALLPPKSHKRSSTRDRDLTWEFKDPVQRNRKGGYTVQPLTVGSWLNYGGIDQTDATAAREKRKERSRALSSSADTTERPKKVVLEEALAKEEEALFRRAYSSFAPSYDNSNCVVPAEIRSMVWWHKVGNKRYNDTFVVDPALVDESEVFHVAPTDNIEQSDDATFERIIEDINELESVEMEVDEARSKTDVEQVLRQVSELIETLASHQRIRNATIVSANSASRTPASPSPGVASKKLAKPDEPSEDEIETYRSLQRELAYLILKLPPYAVAKLNGDQLDEMGVKQLVTFEARDTKGVMDEDLVTRQAKLAAMATASSIASLARPNSSAGQHYNTTANRTPAIGQAANTRYGQQYGTRTPATASSFQRQSSGHQSYGTPSATASRYGQPNQWTRPGATQSAYGQQHGNQQFYQRPHATPSAISSFNQYQQQRYHGQAQQYQHQQQRTASHAAAANAVGYQTSTAQQALHRTVSPAKGYPVAPTPQHRPLYQAPSQPQQSGSGRATPTGYQSQPHTPVNGFGLPPRQPQGIAPRPSSSTPQPPSHQPNGTTIAYPVSGGWKCPLCSMVGPLDVLRSHVQMCGGASWAMAISKTA